MGNPMTEWWQQNADDVAVPIPRRDRVPDAGFSDPRSVNPAPERTSFIPEFRERRRKRAIAVTALGALVVGGGVLSLVLRFRADEPGLRAPGAMVFYLFGFVVAGVGFTVWRVWKWANARDPRDIPDPIVLY